MSPDKSLHPLIQELMQALGPHYQTAVRSTFTDYNFQGADWFLSYVTHGMAEKGITLSQFHHNYPYTNEAQQKTMFEQAVADGFLQTNDDEVFTLTETGQKGVQSFFSNARQALNAISPLPASELNRLADLLKRLVTAIEEAPIPAEKFNFQLSRTTAPDDSETAVSHIDQYITDINVYRDDAHLATWRSLGITGQDWEALTFIWRGEANTAAELVERLPNRSFDEAAYETALQYLVGRGWLTAENGTYQITPSGQKVRDEAEEQTERNFLIGWSTLSADETVTLKNLLTQFKDSLNQMTAEKATAVFSDLGTLTGSISQALFTLTRSGVNPVVEAGGIEKPGHANLLILSSVFDKPVTAEIMRKRSPYSALSRYHEGFTILTEKGLMTGDENAYSLTENGRSLVNNILEAFHAHLGAIQPTLTDDMPLDEWNRLAELLERLDRNLLNAGDPPGTWCIDHVQGLPMPGEPVALDRIDKVLDDINAFRDDAHIAAFKPYKVKGHTWELFTALWREEVTNPAEMTEKYAGRGYVEADYQQALLDLVKRGWVEEAEAGNYVVTANASTEPSRSGRSLREEAEAQTDAYFYLPWGAILPDAEELHTLLNKADTALQQAVEAVAEAVAEKLPDRMAQDALTGTMDNLQRLFAMQ